MSVTWVAEGAKKIERIFGKLDKYIRKLVHDIFFCLGVARAHLKDLPGSFSMRI